jgi:peptidoglycan/xylan/chitin deacetylase (PgdA/CDA1 family)
VFREVIVALQWPEGYQCAVVLSFDVDAESPMPYRSPDTWLEGLGEFEQRTYGPRRGVPRILNLLAERGLPASFYIPAYTVRRYPETATSIAAAGHEIGCHGDIHELVDRLSPEEEEAILVRSIDAIAKITGERPVGYRSPSWELHRRSPALLRRHGLLYDSSLMGDDRPYLITTPDGPLAEVPIQWLLDDAVYFRATPPPGTARYLDHPHHLAETWISEFDGIAADGGCFVLTMHPWIVGRPSRMAALRRVIDHVQERGDVWWTTCARLAGHVLTHADEVDYVLDPSVLPSTGSPSAMP